ncbi:Calx-beta domain-containing protein [Candidatus Poriferisocius sp.]|uniref:Calx-beta domain-containing protein n=1 Tax=Candidatus Poriferisocius sp. TaxID=3101276 RepID=UPI003B01C395
MNSDMTQAAVKYRDHGWGTGRRKSGRQLAVTFLVVSTLIGTVIVADMDAVRAQGSAVTGTEREDVQLRDNLIANQESLLNAYRCLFNIDTQIVPGGCVNRKPEPQTGSTATAGPRDDAASTPVQVRFSSAAYSAAEGTTAQVTVLLDTAPNRTVVIPLTYTFQDGATSADAGTLPTNVTFAADDTAKIITIDIVDDSHADPGESIRVAIGSPLPDGVTTGTTRQTAVDITDVNRPATNRGEIDVYVFYCAAESRGYNQADLTFEANRINEVVGGFFSRESSGLSTLRFLPGGIVSPDLDWESTTIGGERLRLIDDPNHQGIRNCFSEADPPGESQHYVFLVDLLPSWSAGGFAWPNANFPNLGGRVSIAVAPTVESRYEGSYFCSSSGGRPHRVREQPGTILSALQTTFFDTRDGIDCRYVSYWRYLFTIGHEIGHSVYELDHPPGCSIMGKGYTPSSKCPTIYLDEEMRTSNFLNGLYVDCADREKLGWPIVAREDCSSPPPPVEVGFEFASYSAEEGTTAQVTVELDAVPFRTLTIPLTYAFQGGATAADTGTLPTSVTFGPNDKTKIITIPVNNDDDDEVGERVEISFGTPLPADVTLAGRPDPVQTTVSFTDSAPPQVQVSFASTTYTAAEGTTGQVIVQLDRAPGRRLVIPVTAIYQNGANHTDVVRDQSSVTFEAHETTSTHAFDVLSDNLSEPGEGIKFAIEGPTDFVDYATYLSARPLPAGVTVGTPRSTIVTFIDTPPPQVQASFASATYTAAEGTTAQVTVQLDQAPQRTVVIPLTTTLQGGATAADFGTLPANVTFTANETSKTLSFTVTDDGLSDPGESIRLSLGTALPDRVTAGTPSQTTVSFTDSTPPQVQVSFVSAVYTAAEGTTAQVTVQLDQAPRRTLVIPIASTYHNGANRADMAGVKNPVNVTFGPHETTSTFTFDVLSDNFSESGEGIRFEIEDYSHSRLPEGVTVGTPRQTTVTFTDSAPPQVRVRFASATYTANEGTTAQVTVELDKAPKRTVVILLTTTLQGGATAADFGTLPTNVTFTANETSKTLSFAVIGDGRGDPGESIRLSLETSLPSGVTAGTPSQTIVNITDTELSPITVSFTSSTYSVSEGNLASVRLTLNKAPGRTVTIPLTYAYQDGATAADFGRFGLAPANIVFGPNDVAISFGPDVVDDGFADAGESFTVAIGPNLPAGVTAGTPRQATVNITDTGLQQLQVELFTDSTTAAEGTWAHVGVVFSATPKRTLVIPFTVTFQGGATEDDIHDLTLGRKDPDTGIFTATFPIGVGSKPITFDVVTDDLVETGESVTISIGSSLPEGVTLGTPSQITITLTDPPEPEA